MPVAPTLSEVAALAGRALGRLTGPGQVVVVWERELAGGPAADTCAATFTAVCDGRAGTATADRLDADGLQRAARAAGLHARRARAWPAPPLPEPVPGRPHDGFAPGLLELEPADALAAARAAAGEGVEVQWRAGLARIAVASSPGVRASEERSHVVARVHATRADGHAPQAVRAGVAAADVAAAAAEVRALLAVPGGAGAPASGPLPVVLGPRAVASVLDGLRAAAGVGVALGDGPLAGRRGTTVAAPGVELSDAARFPGTLPRAFDAEGVPRRPVPIVRGGLAAGVVHDTASAARAGATSTGHATRPLTLAPYPEHLVLAGGGAPDEAALRAPMTRGLYLPALAPAAGPGTDGGRLHAAPGAALVAAGELAGALPGLRVEVDALGVLAAVEALTTAQLLVPLPGHCPGGIGAAVVPALRAGAGVRVAP